MRFAYSVWMGRLKCRVCGTVFGNLLDICMRADIHAPTVRIVQLWHDADVDKARCIAMRKVGLWTRVQHGFNCREARCNKPLHPFNTSFVPP